MQTLDQQPAVGSRGVWWSCSGGVMSRGAYASNRSGTAIALVSAISIATLLGDIMKHSIALAGLVLAGMFATLDTQAAEMCQEISYKEYSRPSNGPAGKRTDIVKVTKRTRLVCKDNSSSRKPGRTAAIVRHQKSA